MLTYSPSTLRAKPPVKSFAKEDAAAMRATKSIGEWMLALDAIQEAPDSLAMHSATIKKLVFKASVEAQTLYKSLRTLRPGQSLTREEEEMVTGLKQKTKLMLEYSTGLQQTLFQYMTQCAADIRQFESKFPDSLYTGELKAWLSEPD